MKKLGLILTGLLFSVQCFAACDSSTKLMLHMNADFTDSESTPKTMTLVNTPTIDNSVKKLGAGSGKFVAASSQSVTTGSSSDFAFGTGDFTVECFIQFNSSPAGQTYVCLSSTTNGIDLTFTSTTNVRLFLEGTQFNWTVSAVSTGVWYHTALVRSGSTMTYYLDGVSQGTNSSSNSITNPSTNHIAKRSDNSNFLDGWLDELRISNVARYTANFTPPTTEFCGGAFNLATQGCG